MKLFLFLDDYLLDSKQDVERVFPAAKLEKTFQNYSAESDLTHYNVATKKFEAWASFEGRGVLAVSEDGENWTSKRAPGKLTVVGDIPKGFRATIDRLPCWETEEHGSRWHGLESEDKHDPDPARRYKCIVWPFVSKLRKGGAMAGSPGLVACSRDGIDWTADTRHVWFRTAMGSDTSNYIFYNPVTKHWQVICRARNLDRRIAMTESADLENWTEPRVILHPEETDGSCTQFYGMATLVYEDEYFIGAVDYFQTSLGETDEDVAFTEATWAKWLGVVDVRPTYSYDGRSWFRPDRRHTLLPRTEPGEYGSGSIYCKTMEVGDDGKINIYSDGYTVNHGIMPPGYPHDSRALMKHSLRPDGFCYLDSRGWGTFSTRPLAIHGKKLTVNYNAGKHGGVQVQVSDFHRNPLPGFSFKDCVILTGDQIHGPVRWNGDKSIANLPVKERVRIDFRFIDARIYALRVDCGLWFTNTLKPIDRI